MPLTYKLRETKDANKSLKNNNRCNLTGFNHDIGILAYLFVLFLQSGIS